jgi:hypothetical protein
MNPDRHQAIQYLRAPADGLWRWAENGAVVVWRDGSTVAFREEIVQILEWLAPNGLPSFGAIVFLLAACRGKMPGAADIVTISNRPLPPYAGKDAALLLSARQQLKAQLDAALAELAKASQLSSELNSGLKAKCILAEAVFEPAKVERHVEARAVLRGMQEPLSDADLLDSERTAVSGNYIRQIHILSEGLKPHTSDSLSLRLRTGLDALPKEVDADLPKAERARRLIEELSRDREFGAVARAARELMAAIRLPRRLGEREQLAIGGVADITNRGPLDRLLLSELAHDDLTLSVRVALNEALYLRREPPMREPPGTLALLLDSGVRLWGIPRVLGTAVALALIARDKQHANVLTWRARGKQLDAVDLLSRNGLAQHLGTLEPSAHPGESVPAFAEAVSPSAQNQSVLITHRDALNDPEFRRALAENPAAPGFVAAVDRDGRFELHAMPLAHRPALCEADLDIGAIFGGPDVVPPIKGDIDPNLPAIFSMSPFPFLLPLAGTVDLWTKSADGFVYAVLNDRRLVQFRDQRSGARVLANDLPGGNTIWIDCDGNEAHLVKAGASQRPARLLSLSLPHGALRVTDLSLGPEIQAVHRSGDVILVIRPHDVRAYALSDGRLLDQARNPHRWTNGRFFRDNNHFYFAGWDGTRVKIEPVILPTVYLLPSVVTIFDREGMPGPWLCCKNGELVSTETGEMVKLPSFSSLKPLFTSVKVSRDGHQLLLASATPAENGTPCRYVFGFREEVSIHAVKPGYSLFERVPPLPAWNLYRIIESVGRLEDGVALCGRKNRWRKLRLDENGLLRIVPASGVVITGAEIEFPEQPRKTRHGCALLVAQYPNGSRIFLDSRGLLHFKSSDSSLPEVSIVLGDGEVAGWTSDGYVCGPSFFFDGPRASEPALVFERIMKFFSKL